MTNVLDDALVTVFGELNKLVRPAVKAGLGGPLPIGAGLVLLETKGRKSGLPRQVPLLATRVGKRITVTTGRGGSQWFENLAADRSPAVWVGGRRREAMRAAVRRGRVNVATLVCET